MTDERIEELFRAVEEKRSPPAGPAWMTDLHEALALENAFELRRARAACDRAATAVPEGPWRNVADLVAMRIDVRTADATEITGCVERLQSLVTKVTAAAHDAERATRSRALHLLAVARIRLGRIEQAEEAITSALAASTGGVIRLWMTDTFAQILIGQGAWSEAIRTLNALVALRRGDPLGVAISSGHLARLHVQLGHPAAGAEVAGVALAGLPSDASMSRLRLQTLATGALLEAGETEARDEAVVALERLASAASSDPHYLRGYALLTLARASAAAGDRRKARERLDQARAEFTLPSHVALLRYHEAKIDPTVTDDPKWLSEFEQRVASMDYVSEGEIETHLLLARRAGERGDEVGVRGRIDEAYRRAMQSNNPLWMRWVDEVTSDLDPEQLSDRIAVRFSGRTRAELRQTTREDVTIIFADLVDFTPRALELPPEEVMDTVRGLFELGVPLLAKHRVTPISYMGDGLLAICQGDDHEARGLAFARAIVARAGRVSQVRRILENAWPLDLRAGVASGPAVLGTLGTLFKTEFAAIGATTNLAARLQGTAAVGEVVCAARSARALAEEHPREALQLKGFDAPVDAVRIRVYTRA